MQTLLSTEIERTAASESLDMAGPFRFNGKNSRPVTNIEWAFGMCSTCCKNNYYQIVNRNKGTRLTCKLNAMYMDTEPVNMVPTATKRPSSRTAIEDSVSSMPRIFVKLPVSGSHCCKKPFCKISNLISLLTAHPCLKLLPVCQLFPVD